MWTRTNTRRYLNPVASEQDLLAKESEGTQFIWAIIPNWFKLLSRNENHI